MMEKAQKGLFSAALRIYKNFVVFPGIVSHICGEPCANACVRNDVDEPLSIKALERTCIEQNARKRAEVFSVGEKDKDVLIVGGGMSALSCAAKMAQRGYRVRLLERQQKLGGRLWGCDERTLPAEVIQNDLMLLEDLKLLTIETGVTVDSLDAYESDVVLIATGEGGDTFGAKGKRGHFFIGSLVNARQSIIQSIRDGIDVSYILENYLKVGWMESLPEHSNEIKFAPTTENIIARPAVRPDNPAAWTANEAKAEATRCILCDCHNCVDVCDMLKSYRKNPKKTILDARDSIYKNAFDLYGAGKGLRQIMSCSQCGRCVSVCPAGIDMRYIFSDSKHQMHQRGDLPDSLFDFWVRDMEFSNGDEASLLLEADGKAEYLYFPGCQMGASDPEYVKASWAWMNQEFPKSATLSLGCCGAPAFWAGDAEKHLEAVAKIRDTWNGLGCPTAVLPCPNCSDMFRTHLPEIETVSLWELMADRIPKKYSGRTTAISVFDPCPSKYCPEMQRSVRQLLSGDGYDIRELPEQREAARCCGYGGLIYTPNAELYGAMTQANAKLGELDFVTYCTNCRDTLARSNKPAFHMLDILFFGGHDRALRQPPDVTQRRRNRERLKRELSGTDKGAAAEPHKAIKLVISGQLREKMDRELILEYDIAKVIFEGEKSGYIGRDPDTDSYFAYFPIGGLTLWVSYRRGSEGQYIVENAYAHRIHIINEPVEKRGLPDDAK
jgi:Fe-S oxidoreductase